jgi:hypothetical protein
MTSRTTLLSALLVAGLALSACSGDEKPGSKPSPDADERGGATLVARSPLTGLEVEGGLPKNPPFVVKIENSSSGEPQYGVHHADLVVEEMVEGGITRLAAIYHGKVPSKIGHVRSLRGTDAGIAAPVEGQVVASGGAQKAYGVLERADVKVWSEDNGAPGFTRDPAKRAPYDRLMDLRKVAANAGEAEVTRDYLPWTAEGATPVPAAKTASRASVRFSSSHTTEWARKGGTWTRQNGHAASGQEFRATSLLVLTADVKDAGYRDPGGNPVPETVFKGQGRATLLRADGGVVEGTWSKRTLGSTISLETADGTAFTVDPGRTWIELVPKSDGSVTTR